MDEAVIYQETGKHKLMNFEKHMKTAAVELCLSDVSLIDRCGELLHQAREKVADEGYQFKKNHS